MSKDHSDKRVIVNDSMTLKHLTTAHLQQAVAAEAEAKPATAATETPTSASTDQPADKK